MGVLAVHAVLLVHEVVAGTLQVHELAVGLQQLRLLDQILGGLHDLWDCTGRDATTVHSQNTRTGHDLSQATRGLSYFKPICDKYKNEILIPMWF